MKAVGYFLVVKKEKEKTSKTKGGLLLTESQKEDIRYSKAKVISIGDNVVGVNIDDEIFYDKHAGHQVEIEKEIYQVIKVSDVVIVL